MAEIILPPEEEQEETPQAPELNIDKPTENSKVITIEFEAKKTNKVSTKDTNQQLYTTDTDAWFEFKETSLEGANGRYSVVFRNRHDGSTFQRTGDVANGVAYYKIPHQEIRHAGAWRGQIVYALSNGDTTAREFDYDVKGHILDGKDVREIVVEDFETLMSQLRNMKDSAEVELAGLVNTANQNETDRQAFFDDLVDDIEQLQANYQELLDTGVLQTNINTKLEALEEEYAPKLTEVTAQLAQKVGLGKKAELEDLSPTVLSAIEGGEGTEFNLLSIPQDDSVSYEKMTDGAISRLDKNTIKRALTGSLENLILFPPNNRPLTTYAAEVEDDYYRSNQANSIPQASFTPEKTVELATNGYLFYRLSTVKKLAPGNYFSFFVQSLVTSNNTKVEYRFAREDGSHTSITSFNNLDDGAWGTESILIPSDAIILEIRLDNRGSESFAIFKEPMVVPAKNIGLKDTRVDSLINDIKKIETEISSASADRDRVKSPIPVLTPLGFVWENHLLVDRLFTNGKGEFFTDFDVSEMKNEGGVDYYVAPNGLSTNDGLTENTPLSSILEALDKSDVGTIWVKGGNYYRHNLGTPPFPDVNKDVSIIGYDGMAKMVYANLLTWEKTEGYSNVYQANRSAVSRVVDALHEKDDYLEMIKVSSVDEVENTVNSWYTEGGVVYVHTVDKRKPDDDIWALMSNRSPTIQDTAENVYLENIEFVGFSDALRMYSEQGNFYAKKCNFKFAAQSNGNGLSVVGGNLVILQECIASNNSMDGFNYHISAEGTLPKFIEINCTGHNNGIHKGTGGSRSDNGSTAHDGVVGIRVGGSYYRNDGGNVADVNGGTQTWNLGTIAFESLQGSDFLFTNGSAEGWLDHCKAYGSTNSLNLPDSTAKAYVRMGEFQTENIVGTKEVY